MIVPAAVGDLRGSAPWPSSPPAAIRERARECGPGSCGYADPAAAQAASAARAGADDHARAAVRAPARGTRTAAEPCGVPRRLRQVDAVGGVAAGRGE